MNILLRLLLNRVATQWKKITRFLKKTFPKSAYKSLEYWPEITRLILFIIVTSNCFVSLPCSTQAHLQEGGKIIPPSCGKIPLDWCFVFSQAKVTLEIVRNAFLHLYAENRTKFLLPCMFPNWYPWFIPRPLKIGYQWSNRSICFFFLIFFSLSIQNPCFPPKNVETIFFLL